jgi:hypothetical protein
LLNALLLLLVGLGIIPLTSGQQFWWLAPLIAGVGVISIVWFNYGERKLREWRMRKPYSVCFKLGQSGDAPTAQELTVPANSEVQIDLRLRSPLQYVEHEIVASFDGRENERPQFKRVSQPFVKVGLLKNRSPEKDEGHYIDYNDSYHIKTRTDRIADEPFTLGFLVQTRNPGRYPIEILATTDAGKARPKNKPVLIVEPEPKNR